MISSSNIDSIKDELLQQRNARQYANEMKKSSRLYKVQTNMNYIQKKAKIVIDKGYKDLKRS